MSCGLNANKNIIETSADLNELCNNLFNNEVQDENVIDIEFGLNNYKELFEELIMIFTEGMKILFGDIKKQVNLNSLSKEQFNLINRYFKSFGFKLEIIKIMNYNQKTEKILEIESINNTELYEYYININSNGRIFKIRFDKN
jgi:hypothetical protein